MYSKNNIPLIIILIGFLIISFHLSNPLISALFRNNSPGISLELFSTFLILFFSYKSLKKNDLLKVFIPYFIFVALIIVGGFFSPPISYREFTTPIAHLIILSGSFYLFYIYPKTIFKYINSILFISIILFLTWVLIAFITKNVEQEVTIDGNRYKIFGMRSTEFPIIMGSQVCYLLYLKYVIPAKEKILVVLFYFLFLFYITLLVYLSGARSVILGILLIFLIYRHLTKRLTIRHLIFILILSGGLFSVSEKLRSSIERILMTVEGDQTADIRVLLYSDLIYKVTLNPIWGIGHGKYLTNNSFSVPWKQNEGVVPHQNLLGRAAENGIPAAFFYIIFIISYYLSIKCNLLRTSGDERYKKFIVICIALFSYHQFRGLIQDTWTVKELSFVVGASLGLQAHIKEQNKKK